MFDDMGAHLVEFPIALSCFSPNSSVQILGVLENVPLRFKAALMEGTTSIGRISC